MTTPLALALTLPLALGPARVEATTPPPGEPGDATRDQSGTDSFRGPVLPDALYDDGRYYWVVGFAAEAFGSAPLSDQLLGVAAAFRHGPFGPHAALMVDPSIDGYQQVRLLAGLGERVFVPVFGTELSYGVGVHFEVELKDHFWLAYATPLELGALVYGKGSWKIELFVGARRAFAGELIDHFLIDPNGIDNEAAADNLHRVKTLDPWRGFVRIVFGHRLD